ncbi:MAG: exosortase/archaeosortase family protein [Chloroflexota bacterium]|nr:exosortase/archaeosortase family protein [Chloroflexota bacterium]
MKPKTIIITVILVAVITLFYWPTFRWLVNSWLSSDYYSHGFLVPLISGFFIWIKRDQLRERQPSILGTIALGLGALFYILGSFWEIRFLNGISLIIVITALSLSFLGIRSTRVLVFPLAFLVFMVPPPFIQDLGYHLQTIAVNSSTWLLETLGLPITSNGPEIHLEDASFTVGLACSGTNSLIALLALAAVYVYLLSGPSYKRSILFVLSLPLAILANTLRIAAIIIIAYYSNTDAAMTFHDWSNPLFFLIAFGLLILIGRLMKCKLNYGSPKPQ